MKKTIITLATAMLMLTGCSVPFDINKNTETTTAPSETTTTPPETTQVTEKEIPTLHVEKEIYFRIGEDPSSEPILTTKNVVDVSMAIMDEDVTGSTYNVSLMLDEEGSEIFAKATEQAANDNDVISIWYNDYMINSATVDEPITDGAAYIAGLDMVSASKVTGWIYECIQQYDSDNSNEGE